MIDQLFVYPYQKPNENERVLCFGNKTYCCEEDMEDEPKWHLVKFKVSISSFKIDVKGNKGDIEYEGIFKLEIDDDSMVPYIVNDEIPWMRLPENPIKKNSKKVPRKY